MKPLALLLTALGLAAPLTAQAPRFLVYADTAGASAVGDSVYLTWIFAKATPTGLPSSGILVGFDCRHDQVQRVAHVVYHLAPDSVSAEGATVADSADWVPVSNRPLFDLICRVGPGHGTTAATYPETVIPPVGAR